MAVFVLDKKKKPLMPCSEKRARLLLERGRAVVVRLHPFTIRLKDRVSGETQPIRVKVDPGSKTTGIAVVRENPEVPAEQSVLHLAELEHRGQLIKKRMDARRGFRSRRRIKNLRHRKPRFDNRTHPAGWLPPSLQHRVDTISNWVGRLQNLVPVTGLSMELVRFDMQKMLNPEISGVEYQQGILQGVEIREYLLEKWGRKCVYCNAVGIPLEIDHIHPKSKGGSDRIGNLTIACRPCNQSKGTQNIADFVNNPELTTKLLKQAATPLRDAAAVNATRNALLKKLQTKGFPVETSSGGLTKFNRRRQGIPKTHALDAVCVGEVTTIRNWQVPTLSIKATGRGTYQRTRLTKYGFPRGYLTRQKRIHGFQTGDHVRAIIPTGKNSGTHTGRVAVRANGNFNIQLPTGIIQGIDHRHCQLLQRADGYGYAQKPTPSQERSLCGLNSVPLRPQGRDTQGVDT